MNNKIKLICNECELEIKDWDARANCAFCGGIIHSTCFKKHICVTHNFIPDNK